MRFAVQRALLGFYRHAVTAGVLRSDRGHELFTSAYLIYKRAIEARTVEALRPYVRPGTTAVDVGAHVGFFVPYFCRWVGSEGLVVAIEPEPRNFRSLSRMIVARQLSQQVEVFRAVAAERGGEHKLVLNPHHPGDHRLGREGLSVPGVTLDGLAAGRERPAVSFIKIDVQGAELRVLHGARETLKQFRPALFIELDDEALRQQGVSVHELLTFLDAAGYSAHELRGRGPARRLDAESAWRACTAAPYHDLLFLPKRQT